jgi:hypothetical protein
MSLQYNRSRARLLSSAKKMVKGASKVAACSLLDNNITTLGSIDLQTMCNESHYSALLPCTHGRPLVDLGASTASADIRTNWRYRYGHPVLSVCHLQWCSIEVHHICQALH